MKFLSDILAKAGLTVDGVVTLNNTATGQTPDANDNSTKLATTAWVRTFVQPYSLPIASASVLGGIKVGSGLSINSGTGVLSVTGASAASIKSTQTFVVTEGQTVFTVTGGYTPGLMDIFVNGVYLSPNQTTATNGTTFTINDPAATGDIVDIIVSSPIFEGSAATTDQLPEGVVNLYYTNARARAAISLTTTGVSGAATYNSSTGVFNIPNYQGLVPAGGVAGQVLSKVDGNDYNTQWLDEAPASSYTSQLKHRVKSSQAINKGQAVYVSSADGTNMIVSKASNASEATSSKTMGLLESTVSINGTANVITEGLLAGLDTTGANAAGDPVWLGTDGNLIYGLVSKPSAPAHLVFIGVVTRRNANNGEIFVKVQNGFELDELHDLSVKNASDGDMIKYVASTGLWTKIAATTTNITEGTNLYYTQARFDTAFAAKSTSNLTEGTNLYYTTARANSDFDTRLATKSTTNLAEGTNLYYTDTRVGTYLTANSYATQSYVSTQINNLVSGAPGLLDTLDELAAALGDDPNFATTVSTALSNRLRIDIGTQGLTSTQQGYGRTNLGLGSLAVLSSVANAQITDVAWSKVTGAPAFITGYTEVDTLASVTGRGSSTSTAITFNSSVTFAADKYQNPNSEYAIDLRNSDVIGINAFYFNDNAESSGEGINFWRSSGYWDTLRSEGGVLYYAPNRATLSASTGFTVYHSGNLTNLNQLSNGPGYLTSESDTLATVTARGASTAQSLVLTGTSGYNITSNSDIIMANAKPVRGYTTAGSGYRLISIEADNNIHVAGNGGNIIMNGGGILGVGTASPTSTAGVGIEIFEDTNGGTLSLSRDAGNQRGILRFGRNNGGSFQTAARIVGDSDGGTGANGSLYFQVSNSSSTLINALQIASTGASTFISSVTATSFVKVGGTSAQYLKADGSVSTLTNPVTGTGVTQGVAYWTSTSEISAEADFAYEASNNRVRINSNAWDSGGAEAKLIVSGVLSPGSSATVQINGFVRIKDQLLIHNGADTGQDAYIQAVGQGVLTVGNKLLINTTTIGSYQLDVRSSASDVARFVAGSGDALVRIIANNYATEADARLFLGENDTLGMTFEYDGSNNYGHIGMNDSVDPTGAFSKRISMPRFNTDTLFNAGNVGIGVPVPDFKLDVGGIVRVLGSTSSVIYIEGNSGNSKNIFFKSTGAADNSIRLYQDGGTNNFIIATGDGTVPPTNRLTISGTGAATFSSSVTAGGVIQSGTGAAGGFKIGSQWVAFNSANVNYYYTGTTSAVFTNSNGTADLITILPTGVTTFGNSVGIGASPANTMLQIQGDWVGGFSTVRLQGSASNQVGIGLYNTSGQRRAVWAYTGTYVYLETENSSTNITFSPAGVFRGTFYGDGTIGFGGGTSGVSREDIFINPTSGSPAIYIGRQSSTNDDNTKVYFQNRVGQTAMYVDNGGRKVGIKTLTPLRAFHADGGYFMTGGDLYSAYTSDGLWGVNALPNFLQTNGYGGTYGRYGSGGLVLGYEDNGAGLYSPAYGFEVKSTDGIPVADRVVRSIVMKDTDRNSFPLIIYNNGKTSMGEGAGYGRLDVSTSTNEAICVGVNSGTVVSGDLIGALSFVSRDGSTYSAGGVANIRSYATSTYNTGNVSADLRFYVSNSLQNTSNVPLFGTERMRIHSGGRVAVGDSVETANGILQVTGSHPSGYGLINMNSVDSCILSLDSSGSYDVRIRYKYNGTDLWFAGMTTDNSWRLTKGDNTTVIEATQGNNVYISNGGLQIASAGGFTGSAKFLVGSFLSAGSGAIAQFNGFLRIRDQIIIHNNSNTGLEVYLQCTANNELTVGGTIRATGDVVAYASSDLRYKDNLKKIEDPIDKLLSINGYEFDWNQKQETYSGHDVGVIAQEIEKVIPEIVTTRDNGYKAVKYEKIVPLLIEAVKEQQTQIESQKSEIEELKDLVKQLINR